MIFIENKWLVNWVSTAATAGPEDITGGIEGVDMKKIISKLGPYNELLQKPPCSGGGKGGTWERFAATTRRALERKDPLNIHTAVRSVIWKVRRRTAKNARGCFGPKFPKDVLRWTPRYCSGGTEGRHFDACSMLLLFERRFAQIAALAVRALDKPTGGTVCTLQGHHRFVEVNKRVHDLLIQFECAPAFRADMLSRVFGDLTPSAKRTLHTW